MLLTANGDSGLEKIGRYVMPMIMIQTAANESWNDIRNKAGGNTIKIINAARASVLKRSFSPLN